MTKVQHQRLQEHVDVSASADMPDGHILAWDATHRRWVASENISDLAEYTVDIPGTGNIWDDVNAYDFTGDPYADGGCLAIEPSHIVGFIHNGVAWRWVGPKPVMLGAGCSYTSVEADYAATGIGDHALTTNRDAADSHPTAAITGLDTKQMAQDSATGAVQTNLSAHEADTANPHSTTFDNLLGKPATYPPTLPITQSDVTDLLTDQTAQDVATGAVATNLATHEADTLNPHATDVDNLTDTTITTPASREFLYWDGSVWRNGPIYDTWIVPVPAFDITSFSGNISTSIRERPIDSIVFDGVTYSWSTNNTPTPVADPGAPNHRITGFPGGTYTLTQSDLDAGSVTITGMGTAINDDTIRLYLYELDNDKDPDDNQAITYNFEYAHWYGNDVQTSLNETEIKAKTKGLSNKTDVTFDSVDGQYQYIWLPPGWTLDGVYVNGSPLNQISGYTETTVTINSTSYAQWRSNFLISGVSSMEFDVT